MNRRTAGLVVVAVAAAGLIYWWVKRRQAAAPAATATVGDLTVVSWNVAPAQPATPNTPTVDPVWARRNPGVVPV